MNQIPAESEAATAQAGGAPAGETSMAQRGTASAGSPGFARNPDYPLTVEPCEKRVRAMAGGETIADSTRTRLVLEGRYPPVYYFPREDVRMDLLRRSEHRTHCPYKGDASYWSIAAGGKEIENAVWSYETPFREMAGLRELMAFYWDRMEHWFEEDEEVFGHPRDPYHRVDVRPSSRRVRVVLDGETVADTRRGLFLFETGLPARYYIPPEGVRARLLQPSGTTTICPYKGQAAHWSARLGDRRVQDIAWSYPNPLPECPRIRDLVCFYPEKVDAIEVDGAEPASD